MIRLWILLFLAFLASAASAEELLMARVAQSFPETMNRLQDAIRTHGYTVSRVQRVDVGLTSSGFQTAEYRIVFFAKPDELKQLVASHRDLIPYLPLNIVVFAEGEDTLLLTANPRKLSEFFGDPGLRTPFKHWERDLRIIFEELRQIP